MRKNCRDVFKFLFAFHFIKKTFYLPTMWVADKSSALTAELFFYLLLFILSALHGQAGSMTALPPCRIVTGLLDLGPTVTYLQSLSKLMLAGSPLTPTACAFPATHSLSRVTGTAEDIPLFLELAEKSL